MPLSLNFMKPKNWRDLTLAFAELVQICEQIHEIAHAKNPDAQVIEHAIQSLFVFDPVNVADTYGGVKALTPGLSWLAKLVTTPVKVSDKELLQYMTSILYLTRLLMKNKKKLEQLHNRLQAAQNQVSYFHATHPQVIANIADIYTETTSGLSFRVQIRGFKQVLTQPKNMQSIRCLLLAGFRAAFLWYQIGGNRWQLLFSRYRITNEAKALLVSLST